MAIDTGISTPAPSLDAAQAQGTETAEKAAPEARTAVETTTGINVNGKLLATDSMVGLLFVQRAQVFGSLTEDRLQDVQDKLNHYKEMNRALQKMRISRQQAKFRGHSTEMDPEVVAFCKEHNIKLDTTAHDTRHNESEWNYNISSADGVRQKWSDDLRILMTKFKALFKELDASVSGAGKVQDKSAHIAKNIFTGWN